MRRTHVETVYSGTKYSFLILVVHYLLCNQSVLAAQLIGCKL
jgi:hypothetical protein